MLFMFYALCDMLSTNNIVVYVQSHKIASILPHLLAILPYCSCLTHHLQQQQQKNLSLCTRTEPEPYCKWKYVGVIDKDINEDE